MDLDDLRKAFAYDPKTGFLIRRSTERRAGTRRSDGYRTIAFNNKRMMEHRLIWFYVHGAWPEEIDHENRINDDNRLENLREVTHAQNIQNRILPGRSCTGIVGVREKNGKFKAILDMNGVRHVGAYRTLEAAIEGRKKLVEKYHTHAPK